MRHEHPPIPWYARPEPRFSQLRHYQLLQMWQRFGTLYWPLANAVEEAAEKPALKGADWDREDTQGPFEHQPTLSDVSREMGLSRERVRQIECGALKKVRKTLAAIKGLLPDDPSYEAALVAAIDLGRLL